MLICEEQTANLSKVFCQYMQKPKLSCCSFKLDRKSTKNLYKRRNNSVYFSFYNLNYTAVEQTSSKKSMFVLLGHFKLIKAQVAIFFSQHAFSQHPGLFVLQIRSLSYNLSIKINKFYLFIQRDTRKRQTLVLLDEFTFYHLIRIDCAFIRFEFNFGIFLKYFRQKSATQY